MIGFEIKNFKVVKKNKYLATSSKVCSLISYGKGV